MKSKNKKLVEAIEKIVERKLREGGWGKYDQSFEEIVEDFSKELRKWYDETSNYPDSQLTIKIKRDGQDSFESTYDWH